MVKSTDKKPEKSGEGKTEKPKAPPKMKYVFNPPKLAPKKYSGGLWRTRSPFYHEAYLRDINRARDAEWARECKAREKEEAKERAREDLEKMKKMFGEDYGKPRHDSDSDEEV